MMTYPPIYLADAVEAFFVKMNRFLPLRWPHQRTHSFGCIFKVFVWDLIRRTDESHTILKQLFVVISIDP